MTYRIMLLVELTKPNEMGKYKEKKKHEHIEYF